MRCIFDSELVSEKKKLKEELFRGISLNILILLLDGEKSSNTISEELKIPNFKVMLYISRLIKAGIIEEAKCKKNDYTIERIYKLASRNIEIINQYKNNIESKDSRKKECKDMATHFSKLTSKSIENIYKHKNKPYTIKSCFIKGDEKRMIEFKNKLDNLFKEFNDSEDDSAEETYGFTSTFTPYDVE